MVLAVQPGTVVVSLLSSSVLAGLISAYVNHRSERERWLRDKRLEEWRELVVAVEEAVCCARKVDADVFVNFKVGAAKPGSPIATIFYEARDSIEKVGKVLRTRIFLREAVREAELQDKFMAFRAAFHQPNRLALWESSGVFEEALRRAIDGDEKLFSRDLD